MDINRPFLNYQFTQTAYRNNQMAGSALQRGELPELSSLAFLVKRRLRKRLRDTDERICFSLMDEKDANRALLDGHAQKLADQMGLTEKEDQLFS